MNEQHDMQCHDARRTIPSYLDGELSEAQAAPLRRHLLDCQPCRASAQSDKNLKRWFVEPKGVPVPRDFASRVARRAFAGDTGERFSPPSLVGAGAGGGDGDVVTRGPRSTAFPPAAFSPAALGSAAIAPVAVRGEERNLRFVLSLTAAAAAVLFFVSLSIRSLSVPDGSDLRANDERVMSVDEALRDLDRLNAAEAERARAAGVTARPGATSTNVPTPGTGSTDVVPQPERRP